LSLTRRIEHVHYGFECGPASWRVRGLVLEERLDAPFRGELRLVADRVLSAADLLASRATLSISRGDSTRTFRGQITYAELMQGTDHTAATVCFEPAIASLARGQRYRVFQGRTTLQIVEDVVAVVPALRVETVLSTKRPVRDYCTQYGETDLAFVCRLLAEDGIAWFLDDTDDDQTLRLVDTNAAMVAAAGPSELRIIEAQFDEATEESVQSLRFARRRPGAGVLERSWDWLGATVGVTESRAPADAPEPLHELHQVRRNAAAISESTTQYALERMVCLDLVGRGTSNATNFMAGRHVSVSIADDSPLSLLLTRVQHAGDCPDVELGAASVGPNYTNTFECQPLDVPYRPQRTIPRPRIHSLHTAVVVGPPNEDIYTDEHGRIRVRMHWDRATTPDGDASCWLRVAQSWAGQGWGSMFIPRVGMEVLVAFLDGDPDRPICVGCVYNGAHRPPYHLPGDRTKSTIRTQSTPGGEGHNELTFDDAAGSEQVYLRAQRDLDAHVLHDLNTKVGAAETRTIGGGRHTAIDRDDVVHVRQDEVRHVDGAQEIHVGGSVAVQIDGGPALGDAAAVSPGMSVSIINGGYRLTAPQRIELVCGPSAILMTPAGITITGPSAVNLVCGGAMVALAPAALSLAAPVLAITAPGAMLGLGASATLASPGGVKLECGDECELTLNGRATIMAGEVIIDAGTRFVAMASKMDLDASDEAVMRSDGRVRLADPSGSVVLQGGTIALEEP
jgi:type VI secretion system secreted protein VgrG